MSAPIEKVCLVGANGSLGSVILDALVAAHTFSVSVLVRANSTSTPAHADRITQIPFSPTFDTAELTRLLAGQDAVIAAFPLKDVSQHLRLAEAACAAGVRRYVPADYGSCDARSPRAQRHLQLYRDKAAVQALCETLAKAHEGFSWTSIVSGHFFDWGLRNNVLNMDVAARTALALDDGTARASASTLPRVAQAVVRVLQRHKATRDRFVFVQSFCATPLEVLAALERATGGEAWKTDKAESEAFLDGETKKYEAGDEHALHNIVFALGQVGADWTTREEFAMDLLGLEDEDLDEVVERVVGEMKAEGLA
ncbi:NmrA family transcriptional regulator [Cordyceps fumosorosea ARSEF 2679]|uniref:NmrA family transcriptional regulator n=1 Tax=Cordyceps fumosorosea (strain ARSEF 2679) TaxID=1081104 RepID=A0A162N0T2_CORFA|nr:NmrA family transcriptional regulator [Cordyceps fumosorosea ARSEF 2679]OAA73699.1 NmrA family transcriptional regulator [Cordyceps fumosorosea ARSEF 2679]